MSPSKAVKDQGAGAARQLPREFFTGMEGKGYKRVGGNVLKWEAGLEVEGIYAGIEEAKAEDQSPILHVVVEGKTESYWCPTILESRLEGVAEGTGIYIVCLGQVVAVKGRKVKAWGFEVFTK